MNHVAVNVPDIKAESTWFKQLLNGNIVFERDAYTEPATGKTNPDCHHYLRGAFYVTLRERPGAPAIDHIGWMTTDKEDVELAYRIVSSLGWEIVIPPTTIDESYLFHFVGPDGAIHDFFYPTEALDYTASVPPSRTHDRTAA